MPNGKLSQYYEDSIVINKNGDLAGPLAPGKNDSEARFRYIDCNSFKLLDDMHYRTKVLYWNENIVNDKKLFKQLKLLFDLFQKQCELENSEL